MCVFFDEFVYNSAEVYMDTWHENTPLAMQFLLWGKGKVS